MIITLLCGEYIYSCNILRWNNIRLVFAKAINEYVANFKTKLVNDNGSCKEDLYNNSIDKNLIITAIDNFIKDVKLIMLTPHPNIDPNIDPNNKSNINPNIESNSILISLFKIYFHYLDLLTIIDAVGIYALMIRGDNCGYYSVGNSHDIITMFKNIIPFIDEDDYMKEAIHNIIQLFQASIDNSMIIVMTSIENIPSEKDSTSLIQNIYEKGSLTHLLFKKRIK